MRALGESAVPRPVNVAFGAVSVLALWTLARPYVGLRHDGILYLGQTLFHLQPQRMSHDIFFEFGSQDRYSIIAPLLAALTAQVGADWVQILVPSASHVALLAIAFQLLRGLPDRERWLGLAALAVLSHNYGAQGVFAFAERFVTGRTIAEPLSLLALLLVVRGRWLAAVPAITLAGAMHPLVALPVVVVGWLVLCSADRRWWLASLLLLVPVVLAAAGLAPFDGLLKRYDDVWWDSVQSFSWHVLPASWKAVDWQGVVFDLLVVAAAAAVLPPGLRPLLRAVVGATALLLTVSTVGADLFHNVLITQLQVWRVLWLTHLVALLCLPALWAWAWQLGAEGRLVAWALAAAVTAVNARWETGWVLIGWTAVATWMMMKPGRASSRLLQVSTGLTVLALLALSVAVAARVHQLLVGEGWLADLPTWALLAVTVPLVGMSLATSALWAWGRGGSVALGAMLVMAIMATSGVMSWDRRSDWTRFLETGLEREHPFSRLIPPQAQVYWHASLPATWFLLQRPSYFSDDQGTGLLFNRETNAEYVRRRDAFAPLRMQAEVCSMVAALNPQEPPSPDCVPTDEVMRQLCQIPKGPDFMVFERRSEQGRIAEWTFAAAGTPSRTFYLYACDRIR